MTSDQPTEITRPPPSPQPPSTITPITFKRRLALERQQRAKSKSNTLASQKSSEAQDMFSQGHASSQTRSRRLSLINSSNLEFDEQPVAKRPVLASEKMSKAQGTISHKQTSPQTKTRRSSSSSSSSLEFNEEPFKKRLALPLDADVGNNTKFKSVVPVTEQHRVDEGAQRSQIYRSKRSQTATKRDMSEPGRQQNQKIDQESLGPFTWEIRDRTAHSGVHPFNMTMEELQERAEASAAKKAVQEEPHYGENLHRLFRAALTDYEAVVETKNLVDAKVSLQAAYIVLRGIELKERMSILRVVAARAQQKLAAEIEQLHALSLQATAGLMAAHEAYKDKKDELGEAAAALLAATGEVVDVDSVHPVHVADAQRYEQLIRDIDAKIAEYHAQVQVNNGQTQANAGGSQHGEKRKR